MTEDKTGQLIAELNEFGEARLKASQYVEAEERFRTALEVYKKWRGESPAARTAVLTSIAGLVRTLEAQGKQKEAADVLEAESGTVTDIVSFLRRDLELC